MPPFSFGIFRGLTSPARFQTLHCANGGEKSVCQLLLQGCFPSTLTRDRVLVESQRLKASRPRACLFLDLPTDSSQIPVKASELTSPGMCALLPWAVGAGPCQAPCRPRTLIPPGRRVLPDDRLEETSSTWVHKHFSQAVGAI